MEPKGIGFPIVGVLDDKTKPSPEGASKWVRFKHHGTTKRLSNVLISIFVAAACLVIINFSMKQQSIKCTTTDDCVKVKRLNTTIVGTRSLLNIAVAVILLFIILSQLGINPFTLLATAGVLGVVIGFGAQSLIKSAFAGIQVMSSGRFSVGDLVQFELTGNTTVKGVVTTFSLQSTTLQHLSGARYYIANGDILLVTNYSQNEQRAQVEFSISHSANVNIVLEHLQKLTIEMAGEDALLDKVIQPPVVKGVTASGPHAYTVTISAIVAPASEIFVERYMRQRVLALLHSLNVRAAASYKYVSVNNSAGHHHGQEETLLPPDYNREAVVTADGTEKGSAVENMNLSD